MASVIDRCKATGSFGRTADARYTQPPLVPAKPARDDRRNTVDGSI
jgi:hypothetical protein